MKDDKFCVSKTVAFLVSLIVIVGGIFYVMNYSNNQKNTTGTEAAAECRKNGVKGYKLYKKNYASCAAYQTRMNVTMTSYAPANGKDTIGDYICCIPGKSLGRGAPDSATTCKGKGGSEWFRDATPDILKKRLETAHTTVTVKEISGASDAVNYPSRHCYTVSYTFKTETGSTCKQLKGAWYSDKSESALETRLSTPEVWKADAELKSGASDATYYTGRTCYKVTYTYLGD